MGPAQAGRALDDSNLAVRVNHRSSRLPNALPMVSSTCALGDVRSAVLSGPPTKFLLCQNLALYVDLMFDQDDVPQRVKKILW